MQHAHHRSELWVAARAAVVDAIALGLHERAAAAPSCLGDCVDSGYATVADLVRGVSVALGAAPIETCPNFDNGGGVVTIDVLIPAVGHAPHGCPRPPICTEPLPTSTPPPSATPADPVVDSLPLDRFDDRATPAAAFAAASRVGPLHFDPQPIS